MEAEELELFRTSARRFMEREIVPNCTRWRADGKEIFYIAQNGMLTAVPVNADATFVTGKPTQLFQVDGRAPISSTDVFTYDVAKDGQRFLVNRYVKPEHVAPLSIILNAGSPDSASK